MEALPALAAAPDVGACWNCAEDIVVDKRHRDQIMWWCAGDVGKQDGSEAEVTLYEGIKKENVKQISDYL